MKSSSSEIAGRYVNALFSLANEASAVAAVEKDLNVLAAEASSQPDFIQFLNNPLLTRDQQKSVIAALADKIAAHALTKKFLATLAEQNRLIVLVDVAAQFSKLAQEQRGEVTAEVISSAKLDDAQAAIVTEQLSRALNKKVTLHYSVDPSLLGGMVVKIGSQQLDASLAGKLNRLNIALKAA